MKKQREIEKLLKEKREQRKKFEKVMRDLDRFNKIMQIWFPLEANLNLIFLSMILAIFISAIFTCILEFYFPFLDPYDSSIPHSKRVERILFAE